MGLRAFKLGKVAKKYECACIVLGLVVGRSYGQ